MQITKKDVIWNFSATVLKIASNVLILPVILRYLSADEVGIWTIFISFSAITLLFDFGFSQTFSRNITYVFSGANNFQKEGFSIVQKGENINYALLKSVIGAMKWFYTRISLIIFLFLAIVGTFYIHYILNKSYSGGGTIIYISWFLYIFFIGYQSYTLYFDSLLLGRGMVKKNKQIIIISQVFFISISLTLILVCKLGILSLAAGQMGAVVVNRFLSHRAFYDKEIKSKIKNAENISHKKVLNDISPNAIKIGITSLGSFLINKSSVFIGSLFLPLTAIASFGVSKQVVELIAVVSTIWFSTFYPKMIQDRINNRISHLKELYLRSKIVSIFLFLLMGIIVLFFGNSLLVSIKSNTLLLQTSLLAILLISTFLENNHAWAGSVLLTKNEVPFFKASIFSGLLTVLLLFLFLVVLKLGVLSLILAPGLAQLIYQNWKWPLEVIKDLNITRKDYIDEVKKTMGKLWMFRLS